ncbi:hypothetical protein K0M31_000534 [Melipona bicolor]|uniref:Uncharacterized protein n=1 Tax=Melipona bicolor TaxID=60889 RepID=A0AA40KWX7_9HYME|nr:hypothetical protein K0M31_000534 [Melipona bicolor]
MLLTSSQVGSTVTETVVKSICEGGSWWSRKFRSVDLGLEETHRVLKGPKAMRLARNCHKSSKLLNASRTVQWNLLRTKTHEILVQLNNRRRCVRMKNDKGAKLEE